MAAIVGLVKDLLDRSRIQGVARALGASVDFVSTLDELVNLELGPGTTIFVDLTDPDLDGIRVPQVMKLVEGSQGPRTIGFIFHEDKAGIAAAESAGFDEVLTRAAFFKRLSVLLAEARDRESAGAADEDDGGGAGDWAGESENRTGERRRRASRRQDPTDNGRAHR